MSLTGRKQEDHGGQEEIGAAHPEIDLKLSKFSNLEDGEHGTEADSSSSKKEREKKEKEKKPSVSAREIFRYATKFDMVLMIVGTITAAVNGSGTPLLFFFFGRMVNNLLSTDPGSTTAHGALVMSMVGIGVGVCSGVYVGCWCITAGRQVSKIRSAYFSALLRQDIGWHDEHKPGELNSRMTSDTRVIQNGINDKFGLGVSNLCAGLSGVVIGFALTWEVTLVIIGVAPVIIAMAMILSKLIMKAAGSLQAGFASAGSIATEVMENVRTVQVFGREEYEVQRMETALKDARVAGLKKELLATLSIAVTVCVIHVAYAISFFFACYMIQWGRRSVGAVLSTFYVVLIGSFSIGMFFPSLTAFMEARAAAYPLFSAIDRVPTIDVDKEGGRPVSWLANRIEFCHVKFAYPSRPDNVLFHDLSHLTIARGQKVAFAGASGCGKSSLVGLIQRFYDPQEGMVTVDGVDLRELDLKQWRDQIGVVSQEPNLFIGSMIENVRIGRRDATYEEVVEACKKANIHDTIMRLPSQYDTQVGSVGSQLSGGQKQRIAIARAVIKRPSILLLDEATSALDRQSEMEVQAALDKLIAEGSMTVIIIAHRLATIRNVDCIYYLTYDGVEGSKLAEQGTYAELMARKGHFAAMAMTQADRGGEKAVAGVVEPKSVFQRAPDDAYSTADGLPSPATPVRGAGNALDAEALAKLDEIAPRTERQKIPIDELAKWEVDHTDVSLFRLLKMVKGEYWALGLAMLGNVLVGATMPCQMIVMSKLLAALGEYQNHHDLKALQHGRNLYVSLFFVFAAGTLVARMLRYFYGHVGEHLSTKVRTLLFRQILRQDMSFFDIPGRDAGSLAGMLSGDCEAIHQLCGASIGLRIQPTCTMVVGLIAAFAYQWKVALVAMACLPVLGISTMFEAVVTRGGLNDVQKGDNNDLVVTEALSSIRTVTAFNLKQNRTDTYDRVVQSEYRQRAKRYFLVAIAYGFGMFTHFGSFALCFWFGGKLMAKGEADFESVMVASTAILMGAMTVGEAGGFAAKVAEAQQATKRVFSVIDRVPDVDAWDDEGKVTLGGTNSPASVGGTKEGSGCKLSFEGAQFIYPSRPTQVVLASVSLDFAAGSSNGLMGQTGCGKSTIIQLLARFYALRQGRIMVNDRYNLEELRIREWRRRVSIVLQEPDLFSGTVRENIMYSVGYGQEGAAAGEGGDRAGGVTDDDVVRVAKWAHIHDDIMNMPEGYDTSVGYKGRALSGGQKQRVAIARGLLRPTTEVLLLDEATSALDNATEARVQEGIEAYLKYQREVLQKEVSVISIAHRLTTIRHCDQIVLLDGGEIVERGTHEELLKLQGDYKRRWDLYAAGHATA